MIEGLCDSRFDAVKAAFIANFHKAPEGLDELGAGVAVCVDGELVVDLCGGYADLARSRPMTRATLLPVFSTGKAVMALLIARALERSARSYDEAVAAIWPDFAQSGKERITVAQLLSHQGGLPGFDTPVESSIWLDSAQVLERLASQKPMWTPGTASGYHPVTIGFLANEVFRRLDGRTLGQALRQDFADRFELDLFMGVPLSQHPRIADLRRPSKLPDFGSMDAIKNAVFLQRGASPSGIETAGWRVLEIPSTNLHATAGALARMLSVVASRGVIGGTRIVSSAALNEAMRERIRGRDRVLPYDISWGAGFMRNSGLNVFGDNPDAVGHCGWGGSCVFADPARNLSMAYVTTRQSHYLLGDPRAKLLIESLYSSL